MGCEIKSDEQRQGMLGTILTPFSFFYLVMMLKYTFICHLETQKEVLHTRGHAKGKVPSIPITLQ